MLHISKHPLATRNMHVINSTKTDLLLIWPTSWESKTQKQIFLIRIYRYDHFNVEYQ